MIKNQNIELLRILSAFGIVWYHSGTAGHEIAYAGLVAFLIISMYLAGKSHNPDARTPAARARRLLRPWAVWCAVYGAINLLMHRPLLILDGGVVAGVLTGPATHLWYMPFIFLCLLLFDAVRRRASPRAMAWGGALLAAALLLAVPWWRPASLTLVQPWPQYAHALTGVLIGVFLAYYDTLDKRWAAGLLALLLALAAAAIPWTDVGLPYLLGVGACFVLIFLAPAGFPYIDVSVVSSCTAGIYFVHVLVLWTIAKLHPLTGPLLPMVAFGGAWALVWAGRKLFPRLAHYWS